MHLTIKVSSDAKTSVDTVRINKVDEKQQPMSSFSASLAAAGFSTSMEQLASAVACAGRAVSSHAPVGSPLSLLAGAPVREWMAWREDRGGESKREG